MNVKKDIVLFGEKLLITSNPKKMKVQDIFKTKAVKEIETEILDIYFDNIARWVPPVALLWYRCFMRTNISYHSCGTAHI